MTFAGLWDKDSKFICHRLQTRELILQGDPAMLHQLDMRSLKLTNIIKHQNWLRMTFGTQVSPNVMFPSSRWEGTAASHHHIVAVLHDFMWLRNSPRSGSRAKRHKERQEVWKPRVASSFEISKSYVSNVFQTFKNMLLVLNIGMSSKGTPPHEELPSHGFGKNASRLNQSEIRIFRRFVSQV